MTPPPPPPPLSPVRNQWTWRTVLGLTCTKVSSLSKTDWIRSTSLGESWSIASKTWLFFTVLIVVQTFCSYDFEHVVSIVFVNLSPLLESGEIVFVCGKEGLYSSEQMIGVFVIDGFKYLGSGIVVLLGFWDSPRFCKICIPAGMDLVVWRVTIK